MISQLNVSNFKCARELEVRLRPLTLLSGLNGSGKSTVLQALGLVFQNHPRWVSSLSQGSTIVLNGPLVRLGRLNNVLSERAEEPAVIAISLKTSSGEFTLRIQSDGTILDNDRKTFNSMHDLENGYLPSSIQYLHADRLTPQTRYGIADEQQSSEFLRANGTLTPAFLAEKARTHKVNEKRRGSLKQSGIPSRFQNRLESTPLLIDQLNIWLQYLSPGVRIDAQLFKELDSAQLSYSYLSLGLAQDSQPRRPAHVGFGLTYCLPILTACLCAPAGSLLLLENPEAHLHPRGQVAMGVLLARCAADGIQIIAETHSDHILNGVRLAVKRRDADISHHDVSLCHFKRDHDTGDSYIESPQVLENGALSEWPEGFFDDWEKSLEELLE